MESYILISQFAKQASVTVSAVHKAIKEKRIKDVKRVGLFYFVHRSEVKKFRAKRK